MLQTLVLSVTYACPIKCRYCGVNAGPHRKEKMSLEMIKGLIDDAHALGTVEVVVFTGGEPFLLGEDLYKAVEHASGRGFLTRIVTNAYWATSHAQAVAILMRFKASGLTELNYSCDDFHQEFIPIERVKWACDAAEEVGLPALIAAKGLRHSTITPEYLERTFGENLTRFKKGKENPRNGVFNYGTTVPVGWESDALTDDDLLWPDDEACWKGPCQSVLKSIVITPEGDLSICCGIGSEEIPETIIGNIHHHSLLDLLIQANNDLVINWLALEGPYGMMRHLQKKAPDLPFRERYVNTCHLCHDLLTRPEARDLLRDAVDEMVPILSLERAWVENHRNELNTMQENARPPVQA